MAEFIDASLTQEVVDAKNELQSQAERAKLIVDSWEGLTPNETGIEEAPIDGQIYGRKDAAWEVGAGTGNMNTSVYDRIVLNNHSTGLLNGGMLTINADNTKFDLAAGTGSVVDSTTDTDNPTYTSVVWPESLALTVDNIATFTSTHIYIDATGTIIQDTSDVTPASRRDNIFLGTLAHVDNTTIISVVNNPSVIINPSASAADFYEALGIINTSGNKIKANGANLSIDKTAGTIHEAGINYQVDKKQPNIKSLLALTPADFLYATQLAFTPAVETLIDPNSFDDGGVITVFAGSNNQATNQRVYLAGTGELGIQYGQEVYDSLTDAIQGISLENYVTIPELAKGAVLIGIISVKKNATDLSDSADAKFTAASKFGEVSVGTGAASVSSLQNAYDNSITPHIVTSAINGAVAVKQGSGADSDVVTQVENGAGTVVHSVTGEGDVIFSDASVQKTALTAALKDKLDAIAPNATSNDTDANLLSRVNHTGSQPSSTISDFHSSVNGNASVVANTAKNTYPTADADKVADLVADAPADFNEYVRKNGLWVLNTGGTAGIIDAPEDGTPYAREDAAWVSAPTQAEVTANTAKVTYPTVDSSKLALIDDNATANSSDATLLERANHTGTQLSSTISDLSATITSNATVANNTAKNSYPSGDASKLGGIATGATVNSTDATLLGRANHTGTQLASTISDLTTAIDSNTNVSANTAKVTFPEAPVDGEQYARVDGAWVIVESGAPTVGTITLTDLATFAALDIKGAGVYTISANQVWTGGELPLKDTGSAENYLITVFKVGSGYKVIADYSAETTYTLGATWVKFYDSAAFLNTRRFWILTGGSVIVQGAAISTWWVDYTKLLDDLLNGTKSCGEWHGSFAASVSNGDPFDGRSMYRITPVFTNDTTDGQFDIILKEVVDFDSLEVARSYRRIMSSTGDSDWVQLTGT